MDTDRFQIYADYFTLAAKAGRESANTMFDALDPLTHVRVQTFLVFENAISAKNTMIQTIESSYERMVTNAINVDPMANSFKYLADHVKRSSGASNLDEYLSDNSIQVSSTYAEIHRIVTGETISDANIG